MYGYNDYKDHETETESIYDHKDFLRDQCGSKFGGSVLVYNSSQNSYVFYSRWICLSKAEKTYVVKMMRAKEKSEQLNAQTQREIK